jgi:hypothetical protein
MSQHDSATNDPQAMLNTVLHSMDVEQWQYLASRIAQPTTAKIIIQHLDGDIALKARYAGMYMRAHDTVKRFEERQVRAARRRALFGRFMTWISRPTQSKQLSPVEAFKASLRAEPKSAPLVWPELTLQ